jgi:hypothetical protein
MQRLLAIALAALIAFAGAAVALLWTPSTTGLIAPASAGEGDDTDTTVAGGGGGGAGGGDTGTATGGVGTGFGGAATPAGEEDDTDTTVAGGGGGGGAGDTGTAQGGVGTGFGGAADTFTPEPAGDDRSDGRSTAAAVLAVVAALGLGGLAMRRTVRSGLGGRQA